MQAAPAPVSSREMNRQPFQIKSRRVWKVFRDEWCMRFSYSPSHFSDKTRIKWSDGFYVVYVCISIAASKCSSTLTNERGEKGFIHKLCCAKSCEMKSRTQKIASRHHLVIFTWKLTLNYATKRCRGGECFPSLIKESSGASLRHSVPKLSAIGV